MVARDSRGYYRMRNAWAGKPRPTGLYEMRINLYRERLLSYKTLSIGVDDGESQKQIALIGSAFWSDEDIAVIQGSSLFIVSIEGYPPTPLRRSL